MSLVLPIASATGTEREPARGLTLSLGDLGLGKLRASVRQTKVVRAVAAAVGLERPDVALTAVMQAKQSPGDILGHLPSPGQKALEVLVQALAARLDAQDGSEPVATQEQVAVARAVDAEAQLVALACAVLEVAPNGEDQPELPTLAARWVVGLDLDALDGAARAGSRLRRLALVPETASALAQRTNVVEAVSEVVRRAHAVTAVESRA